VSRIPLLSGPYQSRSVIAGAQRCVNLYTEENSDPQAPVPVTHYPTPGLTLFAEAAAIAAGRAVYTASNGDLYEVIGTTLFYVSSARVFTPIGTVADRATPVSMADNGLVVVIVDGTPTGYAVDMVTKAFSKIFDPNFLGADRVAYIDTYFAFNVPETNQWFISLSEVNYAMLTGGPLVHGAISAPGTGYTNGTYTAPLTGGHGDSADATIVVAGGVITTVNLLTPGNSFRIGDVLSAAVSTIGGTGSGFSWTVSAVGAGSAFDSLDTAAKTGSADPIVALIAVHGQLWLVGSLTTEIWYNSGAADFTFERQPGAFIEHGCAAPYSVAKQDIATFWLSQDREGRGIIIKGSGYDVERISTHAIEADIQTYTTVSDAIGYCFQQQGHAFYVLTFPTADKTWAYELKTGQWHELAWSDGNGTLHRHRANGCCYAYGKNIITDWQNGILYTLDPSALTDAGNPITRIRTIPHLIKDGRRVTYQSLTIDMQLGTMGSAQNGVTRDEDFSTDFGFDFGPLLEDPKNHISVRWSDTRGASFGNPITQPIGNAGEFLKVLTFNRLGMARDRVFEISWSAPIPTALNGVFIEAIPHAS
jgi:hypothetical protein